MWKRGANRSTLSSTGQSTKRWNGTQKEVTRHIGMNMQENYRLIEALQSAGWTAEEIIDLIKYVESGEEQYKPKPKEN